MSALESVGLQNSATKLLASQTDQPAGPSVLTPFCGKLSVDEELKLSHENFKELIEDFYKDKNVTPLSQLTTTPGFPTPYMLAQFASKAYKDFKTGESDSQYEKRLALPDGWKLLTTASNSRKTNGYFGAAYWHPEHQQVVIAHRGTKFTKLGALWTDVVGVLFKHHSPQMGSASTFAHKIFEVLQEVNRIKGVSFQLFFTGHSLGGWLAQVTTFTTEYLKRVGKFFLRRNDDTDCYHPHTVVFESPGCKDMLSEMRDTFDVRLDGRSIYLEHLDITSYLSAPNRINTCNTHLGRVYRIFPDLSDKGWLKEHTALYNLATHNMKKILETFDPETGQVHKNVQGQLKLQVVIDWPISTGLRGGKEYKNFFEWAQHLNNYHPDITDESFCYLQYIRFRYQTKLYDEQVNSISIFSQEEQEFLQCYLGLRQCPKSFKCKELFSIMRDSQAQEETEKLLQSFEIEKDTVRCTDPSALQALIPYVKRLLHLFPEIREIGNRFCQCETNSCIEQINQSPLDFNPDALSVREFLEDEQQQVLQLKMVDGDEWAGLIKVYHVLQKTNCLTESQYTIFKLERLLFLNMLTLFRTLMQSIKEPYLILVACEVNQLLKEETRDVIRTFFETMKQKPCIKIILTTRLEERAAHFLHHIGREIFGSRFVTSNVQLNWCDLTSSSQEKLLEKSVKFQDTNISLNELLTAESPVAKFLPFGALLEEKELTIADPVPISNGYNEGYYIGRTLRHQKAIKQEIIDDGGVRVARTEQEYKELCQLNPNSNVHWLEKDKSGILLWQHSQGSLEKLRRYIYTESSHTYTADDLDKLLEQAQHQKVMLISDTAGMGKSTVMTHLSKKIKQKFPAKWVVRIDLNDHADAMKGLKQEQIDKKKAIELISEKILKLKPGLEAELFKQCCEQKQKLRIVLMLDGFDEISPIYKENFIDLLQALRQTAVEQLWVTTRPHLTEELEDKLQQLSYTLDTFSEEDQVEFLTKFWCLRDWFTEPEYKGKKIQKENLEIYAEHVIEELANSISDKVRKFTGIPLQTRMLAEAFDKEVKTFFQSAEPMPELQVKLQLFELYRRFIERKYEIYQEEKLQVSVNNVAAIEQRESDLENMGKDHQLLALRELFTEKKVTLFESNSDYIFLAERVKRIGIVQVSHEGKPQFIDPTFAEYYVADYLVNGLTEGNNFSEQVQTFILKYIFLEEDYRVVRVFINGLLSKSKISKEVLKQYGNQIHELGKCAELILHQVVREGNNNIIGFLLDSVQEAEHTDTVNELLLGHDENKLTAWHRAVFSRNIHLSEKLWEWAEKNLTADELKSKLLFATESGGNTAWHWAVNLGKPDVLQKIWELSKENLTTEEIKTKLLLATDNEGKTAWQWAAEAGRLDILLKIWEWAKEHLTTEEIKNKVLLATDSDGNTSWHWAAEGDQLDLFPKIWEWAKENLAKEEIKTKLLLATDSEGNTAWQRVAEGGQLGILQEIWEWAEENLAKEEIKNKLLLATDSKGNTVWHLAVNMGKLDVLEQIWEWAKDNLTTEDIKNKLLLSTDIRGNTTWHMTVKWGKLDVLEKIWDLAKEKLTEYEIKNKLLLATDSEGNTVWHWAAEGGELDILLKIWEWAKGSLTIEEIKNKLLLSTDIRGNTAWHSAAERGELDILLKIWEWTKENLLVTTEEIKNKLLLATDCDGYTAWHRAEEGGQLYVLQKIWQWAKENLTKEEIKSKLLLATDCDGNTVWHLAVNRGKQHILQEIWEMAGEELTEEEIKNNLLLATDIRGNTAWHLTIMSSKLDVIQKMWDFTKEKLTTQETKNNLLATDSEGHTAWHLAAVGGNLDILQKIWELANENLTTDEIKNYLLLATDVRGCTAWHLAVKWGNIDVLEKIWDLTENILTAEERISKLLIATDNDGKTVWHLAVNWGKLNVLEKVWDLVKENLTADEIKINLLLAIDSNGNTVWNLAVNQGKLHVLQKIVELAKDNIN